MNTLKSDLLKNSSAPLCNIESCTVTFFDFINDTERFLDENYRGCYKARRVQTDNGVIVIRAEGYAEALKLIFNSVSASHLITLTPVSDENLLHFDIGLDTSLLDAKTKLALLKLSADSGFSIEITDNNIKLTFTLLDASYSAFQAVSSTFIYNILKKTFTA